MPRKPGGIKPKLSRVPGKTCWYIAWSENRRSRRISTGTTDRAEAEVRLAEFVAGLNAPPPEDEILVRDAIAAYVEHKKTQGGSWAGDIERLLKPALEHFGPYPLHLVNKRLQREFIAAHSGKSAGTVRKYLSLLIAALNFVKSEGWTAKTPTIELPSPPPPRDRWLTRQEAMRLVAECREHHLRLFVLLSLHTGARKGAILQLTWEQIDLENKLIDFAPPGHVQSKKRRVPVPVNNVLLATLREAQELAQTDWVIEWAGKPVGDIKKSFASACKAAKITGACPYTLRHTAATWMAQAGVSLWEIAGVLGHRDIRMVQEVYGKHHPDYLRAAVNALNSA